jgi:hypothetical protein
MFDWMPQFDRFSLSPDNVPAAEKTQSELHKLFYSNTGTLVHKWRHYLKIYEDHLSRFRNTPFHMLEIGVSQGGSLSLWRRYFGLEALLFGIDIDDSCRQFDKRDAHVRIGSKMILHFCDQSCQKWAVLTLCLTTVATRQAIS